MPDYPKEWDDYQYQDHLPTRTVGGGSQERSFTGIFNCWAEGQKFCWFCRIVQLMPCKGFMVSCFFWLPVLRKFVGRHNQLTVEIFDTPDRWSYGSLHRAVATLNWWGGRDFVVPRASKCIKHVIYLGRCFEGFCWWNLLMILCNEKNVSSFYRDKCFCLNLIQTQLVTLYKWDMQGTYHVHNMFEHVYSNSMHNNCRCFKLRKGTVSLPGRDRGTGHRSGWRWRCCNHHNPMMPPGNTERSCTTKTARRPQGKDGTNTWQHRPPVGKDGGERWGVTEELCIYSFWHADANLDLDVLPSLTARKAKKKSPEFGCLPSEDEQWNGQKHSSPMVQRSDYPPHSPQMAYGMATRWSNSRSEYPALNIQPFQRALMWIHKYKSSYHDNEGTSTSEDLLIYSYIHTQVNFECLLQSKPVDSVVQSSSQLDFAGKSRTTTMEWQRENDLDHSHGSQLTRPANESFSFSRRCNWYSSLWLTIIQ